MAYMTRSVPVLGLRCNGGTKEGARQQRLGEAVWRPWPEQAWRTAVMAVGERSGLKNDFRLILGLNRGRGPTGTSGVQMGSTPSGRREYLEDFLF